MEVRPPRSYLTFDSHVLTTKHNNVDNSTRARHCRLLLRSQSKKLSLRYASRLVKSIRANIQLLCYDHRPVVSTTSAEEAARWHFTMTRPATLSLMGGKHTRVGL